MLYIILNPWSDKGKAGQRESLIRSLLNQYHLSFEIARTSGRGEAIALARAAAERGCYRAVVAAGGDGTINEIVNGLLGTHVPLGFLPIGTGNDIIKMFDLSPARLDDAVRRLRDGQVRPVDVGVVNGRAFLNGLGVGFDACIAVEASRLKRVHGFAVYVVALIKALIRFRPPEMTISFDGQTITRRMLLASVSNGRCHGGGFWITPDAEIDDGLFDLCLVNQLRIDEFARHIPKVLKGRHTRLRQVTMARAREVIIDSSTPVAAHVDGEILGTDLRHFEVKLLPGALNVLA